MINSKSRRKLSNFFIDPKPLARLSIPFLTMAIISIAIVFAIQWKVMGALQQTELHGLENLATLNALLGVQESVTRIGTYGLVILCLSCLGLWIVFSHRIFGPTVSMRRHIQNLIAGDYKSRITSRSGDEFKELIEDLNKLAEVLASKKN